MPLWLTKGSIGMLYISPAGETYIFVFHLGVSSTFWLVSVVYLRISEQYMKYYYGSKIRVIQKYELREVYHIPAT